MKGYLVALLALVCAVNAIPKYVIDNRIVGGTEGVPHATPYMVSLQWVRANGARQHFCGGVLVAVDWVLTAASCVDDLVLDGHFEVVAGLHRLSDYEYAQIHTVSAIIIHNDYQHDVGPNDLAMLYIEDEFYFSEYVQAIALPPPNYDSKNYGFTLGWGDTATTGEPVFPDELHMAVTYILDFEDCDEAIGQGRTLLSRTNICTGSMLAGGIGFCTGDAGGPLIEQDTNGIYTIIGIASWGFAPCGSFNSPAVYTKVSAFNAWIYDVMY